MSDGKNEEAGKQEETELSEDQLEEVAGGAQTTHIPNPVEEGVDPFAGVKDVDSSLEEQKQDEIQLANDSVLGVRPPTN